MPALVSSAQSRLRAWPSERLNYIPVPLADLSFIKLAWEKPVSRLGLNHSRSDDVSTLRDVKLRITMRNMQHHRNMDPDQNLESENSTISHH